MHRRELQHSMTVETWGNIFLSIVPIKTPEINVAIRREMWKVIRNSVQERKNRLWRTPFTLL